MTDPTSGAEGLETIDAFGLAAQEMAQNPTAATARAFADARINLIAALQPTSLVQNADEVDEFDGAREVQRLVELLSDVADGIGRLHRGLEMDFYKSVPVDLRRAATLLNRLLENADRGEGEPYAWGIELPDGGHDVLFNREGAEHLASRKRGTVIPLFRRVPK